MNNNAYHIAELITRQIKGELNDEERQELDNLLASSTEYRRVFDGLKQGQSLHQGLHKISTIDTNTAREKTVQQLFVKTNSPVHRVHFLKRAWVRYAAAVIILMGTGAYLWNTQDQKEKPDVVKTDTPVPMKNDVAPGGNRATLTLAGGRTIHLDSAARGALATQPGAMISKSADGQIIYRSATNDLPLKPVMNTMSTPRGGQYQLVLPDGSRVWLNAESSITYPVVFAGNERKVSVTGEAYFEVAKNAAMPFRVQAGSEIIEVLGTHFNVHAYADESVTKTSLLEGSVRVGGQVLRPGQAYTHGKVVTTDLQQDVAWKNGIFYFNRTPLKESLTQLSRWYDVDVVYQHSPPDIVVTGKMQCSLNLSQVLSILKGLEVKFRIEDRKLIIL